jgi:O-antigen biosynthesis protein
VETAAPPVVRDSATVRDMLFAELANAPDPFRALVPSHIYPAVDRMQARHHARAAAATVEEFGAAAASPIATIIVPLYRRIDFVEHQLAQFMHDPDLARADLVYVLDSPELAGTLRRQAAQLYQLYRLPFRVALLEQNLGFSGANNAGAAIARSDLLLFMNSDVLPVGPGWLATMTTAYRAMPEIGAMGPKLLYEDDSIQHAGMYFGLPFGSAVWQNMHYYKGMHRSLAAANISRAVPAVTGACLMVDLAKFAAVGKLAGTYVQGDYEDSDLCLRLIEAGYRNWYCAEAELYHLEAQSYLPESRAALTQYNGWVHTHLWRDRIADVMGRYPQ